MSDREGRRSIISAFARLSQREQQKNYQNPSMEDENKALRLSSNYECNLKKDRHEYNHRVQEKIFWAAYIMVAGGALIAAGAAAYYAKGAYDQAKRQADAAESANSPFLFMNNISVVSVGNGAYLYTPEWTNAGTSSAIDASLVTACGLFTTETPPARISAEDYRSIPRNYLIFGPKQTHVGGDCGRFVMTREIAGHVNDFSWTFLVAGKACYRIAGNRAWHLTEFFYVVTHDNPETGFFNVITKGQQNCADKECADYDEMCP